MPSSHARSSSNDFSVIRLEPLRSRRATVELNRELDHLDEQPERTRSDDEMHPLNTMDRYRDSESQPVTPLEKPLAAAQGSGVGPVTWMSLPRKDQLLILFLSRFVDFLQVASLQAYVFYQLKDINRTLTDAQIAQQAGLLQGCFTGAQVMTAILWGKAADASWCGRKTVLVVGLAGTAVSCLGYGFATTFFWAAFWRAFGGAVNGTVGIIRTMVAEITKEKRYQSRAFLILPMSFNVAGMLGPVMGGMLADPGKTLPGLFGEHAVFGFKFIRDYPFALPSLVNAITLSIVTLVVFLFLEETHKVRKNKPDMGLRIGSRIKQLVIGGKPTYEHAQVIAWADSSLHDFERRAVLEKPVTATLRLPFKRVWTRNVILTLVTAAFYDFHLGAFGNIWSLFLSTPRYVVPGAGVADVVTQRRDLPLMFTGGLGMPASTVGFATSFLGLLGMLLQVTLYPPVQARLGTLRSYQWFLFLFPIAYFVAPYLSVLPSWSVAPEPASGGYVWVGILFVLFLQVMARTFTLPASIILLNNCSPHPSVLGTIHGLGQSVSACFRTVGPVVGGWWYGYGLDIGMVAWGWWGVAIMSALACGSALGMYEGSGHEIFLPGEMDDME